MQEEEKEREIRWKQFLYTYNDSFDDEFDEEDWNWGGLCAVELALRKGDDLDVPNGDVFLDELTKNVRSGVPAALRGEVCHIFVHVLEFWSPNFSSWSSASESHGEMHAAVAGLFGCQRAMGGRAIPGATCW